MPVILQPVLSSLPSRLLFTRLATRLYPRLLSIRLATRLSQCSHLFSSSACLARRPHDEASKPNSSEGDEDDELSQDAKYAEMFSDTYLRPTTGQKVFVVQPDNRTIAKRLRVTTPDLQLSELCALVESLPNWTVLDKAIIPLKHMDKSKLFGSGNFVEIGRRVRACSGVTAAVLGIDMLNATQLTRLQDEWGVAVYDRYTVVLQIFQTRARTKEAKLQVALAEIPYYRSRLHGIHSGSLDQQQGGTKFIGGSGETFLETRQRMLRERDVKLRNALDKLRSQRQLIRVQRKKKEFSIIAVVGYTNAGKTSLIKSLTGDQSMQPKNQLFATLDVTAHAGLLPNRHKVLFVDTVGFISDIPTTLIESFAASLEDIAQADVVVHVRDISHPDTVAQKQNVLQTLQRLNLPSSLLDGMIEVCNKTDLIKDRENMKTLCDDSLHISVKEGWGLAELSGRIQNSVMATSSLMVKHLRIPMNGPHLAWLYKEATVESTQADESDPEKLLVNALMTDSIYAKFCAQFVASKSKTKT